MFVAREEEAAVGGDVLQGDAARRSESEAQIAGHVDGIDAALQAGLGGGEPNFISVRRPGEAFFALPSCGESLHLSGKIDDRNAAAVVHVVGMVEEGNLIAFGGDANVADPAGGFVRERDRRGTQAGPCLAGRGRWRGIVHPAPNRPIRYSRQSGEVFLRQAEPGRACRGGSS